MAAKKKTDQLDPLGQIERYLKEHKEEHYNFEAETDYVVSEGTYGSNSQTTTLTVKAAANDDDSTYTCFITLSEWLVTDRPTEVVLNVFGNIS